MQVKCVLCDHIEGLDDHSLRAKRLRNRRNQMYLCEKCYKRIDYKTKQRQATGHFHLYKKKKKEDDHYF
ncbi:uncharacterized protein YlaI [Virgibacillus halotolerans]|uniref:YlaI family protein n=1 Tax=Virgibacillus halotolerans TaxID=1071053 RepID=UPI001961F219|nr:YlaI family protein [Virgibacillus halotolerans]MBM7598726.1 uncharacterized protein YlaI [Virgibacillus halotolerans]